MTEMIQPLRYPAGSIDPQAPQWYLNRELTWLAFNQRVLQQAQDTRTPLLERVKFLAIVGANLDEFFMKRVGGLKQQLGARIQQATVDGRTPAQQLNECYQLVRRLEAGMQPLVLTLIGELAGHGIHIRRYAQLNRQQQQAIQTRYLNDIFPLITPQAVDPAHPFPFISNLSLNLLVTVRYPGDEHTGLTRIKVPVGPGVPRFLSYQDAENVVFFVALEDIIAHHLEVLLPGMVIESCDLFRVTRNANTEKNEDKADDLLALIESELRDRKFAPVVRLRVSQSMPPLHRGMLSAELGLDENVDVYEADSMMSMRDLMQIATLERPQLRDPPHQPIDNPKLAGHPNIFHSIREQGAVLLQHPYESFVTSVERFIREASRDPKVVAIKMTLYRTSADSRIIDYLIDAARNGKQVAVVLELKARFDEAANIRWASRLEEAGIHVTYGVVGLKTHSKVVFVLRQDYDGLRRYAHIGTGNYHAGTARLYSDLGLLTCNADIGSDLTEFFNYLTTGYVTRRHYRKLLLSPHVFKQALLEKIEREIRRQKKHSDGLLRFKMNALEDADITAALYRASQAGVTIDLLVRDTCRLRPGISGLSEHIRVISIVGRFLEHSRIYYFANGGAEEYFIGSADCMQRNLESRVEIIVPIEAPELCAQLRQILDIQFSDCRSAWEMQPDGSYRQRRPGSTDDPRDAQARLIELAEQRQRESLRLKKRLPRGFAKNWARRWQP